MKYLSKLANGLILSCALVLCLACVHTNYAQAEFILGEPVNFGSVLNSEFNENAPHLSNDGLTIYFHSNRANGFGKSDIWSSTRDSLGSEWNAPANFATINTEQHEHTPFISMDGLTFLYEGTSSDASGNQGQILQMTRDRPEGPWGPPVPLPATINDGMSIQPFLSVDERTLLFSSRRRGGEGGSDIWEAIRPSTSEPWTVHNLGANVNTDVDEKAPVLSSDGLTLLFGSYRTGGEGDADIWMSTRDKLGGEWGTATHLGPLVNSPGSDFPSQLWEAGNLLVFKSGGVATTQVPGLPGEGGADMFYVMVVPEPSTSALSLCGALLLLGLARQRPRCK